MKKILCTVPLRYRSSLGLAAMFTRHLPKHLMRVPSLLVLRVHPRMRRRNNFVNKAQGEEIMYRQHVFTKLHGASHDLKQIVYTDYALYPFV